MRNCVAFLLVKTSSYPYWLHCKSIIREWESSKVGYYRRLAFISPQLLNSVKLNWASKEFKIKRRASLKFDLTIETPWLYENILAGVRWWDLQRLVRCYVSAGIIMYRKKEEVRHGTLAVVTKLERCCHNQLRDARREWSDDEAMSAQKRVLAAVQCCNVFAHLARLSAALITATGTLQLWLCMSRCQGRSWSEIRTYFTYVTEKLIYGCSDVTDLINLVKLC